MKAFLKKNWFTALVFVVFAGITVFYIYDTNKGKLPGMNENGEDVVYSVGDEKITASELYDEMFKQRGSSPVVTLFQKAVADSSIETTDEMKEIASQQAESIISSYRTNYGAEADEYLKADLASIGSADLEEYLITSQKLSQLISEYAKNHFDELKIRRISYILIQFEDPANASETPTEDEKARLDKVDQMLKDGKTFAETASECSEDTTSAPSGGDLGVIDVNTSKLDTAFFNAAMELEEGEISDWVYSENFGFFRIMCTAATPETLETISVNTDPYQELTENYDTTLGNLAVWEKAQEIGVDFGGNEEVEQMIRTAFTQDEE